MGRRAKTEEEKKISGTQRDDRKRYTRRSTTPNSKKIKPEIKLNNFGKKVYRQVKAYLEDNGILFEVDSFLITQYAYFAQVFKITAEKIGADHDQMVTVTDKGNEYMSVNYQVLANAKNQMNALSKILGIGPYYRQSIRAFDEEPAEEDPVEAMMREMRDTEGNDRTGI